MNAFRNLNSRPLLWRFCFYAYVFFILYSITNYGLSYSQRFPIAYAKSWHSADKAVSTYLAKHQDEYDKIIIDPKSGFIYTSFLYYTHHDPAAFQNSAQRETDTEGFSIVKSFEKYELREINWDIDGKKPRTLFITNASHPSAVKVLETFYYPKRPVVLSLKEQLASFPVQEVAYVIVTTQ